VERITFLESRMKFDFPDIYNPYKFDAEENNAHLKKVDFVVETKHEFLFIEVKNYDAPTISSSESEEITNIPTRKEYKKDKVKLLMQKRSCERAKLPCILCTKFKDSLLGELAEGKNFTKPIRYIIVLKHGSVPSQNFLQIGEFVNDYFQKDLYFGDKNLEFTLYYINNRYKHIEELKSNYDIYITID